LLRVCRRGEDVGDLIVSHLVREAIAAEEETTSRLGFQLPDVERHLCLDTERTSEDVAMGMDGGFLRRELALADHLLHDGVVVCQLAEPLRAPVEHVGPRVPDVDENEAPAPVTAPLLSTTTGPVAIVGARRDERRSCQRRPHAV
jgi:hypothetical protein